jgi:hypothetical protein
VESKTTTVEPNQIDQRKFGHAPLQLPEPRIHKNLALLCHVILGIFRQISHGHGFLNLRRQLVRELVFQDVDFSKKLLLNVLGHQCPLRRAHRSDRERG